MPVPGSLLAAPGHFDVIWIALPAFTGAVIGDNVGFVPAVDHLLGKCGLLLR